jgi:PTH1 family peptidyl-tRNA hydrolase
MTKMIVGLGNIGSKYKDTKHNIGFNAVEEIARRETVFFSENKTFHADVAEFRLGGEKIMLVKPTTFMNDSGRAVGPLMTYFGVDLEDLLVIFDDLDMEVGKLRVRAKGSAGGHNGIKSIISHIGTQDFSRIKIGIGRPPKGVTVVNQVLGKFSKDDRITVDLAVEKAADAAMVWAKGEIITNVMNKFN